MASNANVLGTAVLELTTDATKLDKGIDESAERASGRMSGAFSTIAKAGAAAFAGIGVAAVAGSVNAVQAFAGFERQMQEVFTLLPDISGDAMSALTSQTKEFAKEFGTLPEEVVPALYQSLSAGVPQDNVFEFLETAQKAAIAGVTDLTTAVDGVSSVVNAYGSDVLSAAEASDLMFTAVRLGKTNFEELSASLFNVTPVASSLGVQFGDVTAALAALTAQGTPTSVATTQIRAALVELSKEGTKTSDAFQELSGQTFTDFIANGGDLQGALQLLEEAAAESGVGIADMFSSVEAGQAALALTGRGTDAFTSALEQMDESAGATDAAFDTMDRGIGRSIDKIKANLSVLRLEVGSFLAPVVASFLDLVVQRGLPALQNLGSLLRGPVQSAFVTVRDSVSTFLAAIRGEWVPDDRIRPIHQGIGLIGLAIGRVIDPIRRGIGLVQTFVGAVGELIGLSQGDTSGGFDALVSLPGPLRELAGLASRVAQNFGAIMTVFSGLGGTVLKEVIAGFGRGGLQGALEGALSGVEKYFEALGTVGGLVLDALSTIGGIALEAIQSVDWGSIASDALDLLVTGFETASGLLADLAGIVTDAISEIDWGAVASTIVGGVETALGAVAGLGEAALSWLVDTFGSIDYAGIAGAIGEGIGSALGAVSGFASDARGWIESALGSVDWSGAADAISGGVSSILARSTEIGESVASSIAGFDYSGTASSIGDSLGSLGGNILDFGPIRDAIAGIMPIIAPFIDTIRNNFAQAFRDLQPAISQLTPLLGSLRELGVSLIPVLKVAGVIVGGVLLGAFLGLATAVSLGARVFATVLGPAITLVIGIIETLTGTVNLIVDVISGMVSIVSSLIEGDWSGAWDAAGELVGNVVDDIVQIVGGLPAALLGIIGDLVGEIIGFFTDLFMELVGGSIVVDMVDQIVAQFLRLPAEILGVVTGFVGEVLGSLGGMVTDGIQAAVDLIGGLLGEFGRLLVEGVQIFIDFYTGAIGELANLATEGATKAGEILLGILGGLADLIGESAGQGVGLFVSYAERVLEKLGGLATDALGKAEEILGQILAGLAGLIDEGPAGAVGQFVTLATRAGEIIGGIALSALQWGLDIVGGLTQGIIDGAAGFLSTVQTEIIDPLKEKVTGPLGFLISSPSQWARDVAYEIVNGLAIGIDESAQDAIEATARLVSGVADALSSIVEFVNLARESGASEGFDIAGINAFVTQLKIIGEHAVLSIGETAALFSGEFLEHAEVAGQAIDSAIGGLVETLAFVGELAEAGAPIEASQSILDSISALKFLAEHAIRSIGESAALFSGEFLTQAELLGDAIDAVVGPMSDVLEFLLDLREVDENQITIISGMKDSLDVLSSVSLAIAQSWQEYAASWREDVSPSSEALAEAVDSAVGPMSDALDFLLKLNEIDENQISLQSGMKDSLDVLSATSLAIARSWEEYAANWREDVAPSSTALGEAIETAIGPMSDVLGFLLDLGAISEDQTLLVENLDSQADILAAAAVVMAGAFQKAAGEFNGPVTQSFRDFAEAADLSLGLATSAVDAIAALIDTERFRVFDEDVIEARARVIISAAERIIAAVAEAAERFADTGIDTAAQFATDAGVVVGLITQVADAYTAVADTSELSEDQVEIFATNFETILDLVERLRDMATGFLPVAIEFRDTALAIAEAMREGAAAMAEAADIGDGSGQTVPSNDAPSVPGFAGGLGVFDEPTMIVVGEGGETEYVLTQSQLNEVARQGLESIVGGSGLASAISGAHSLFSRVDTGDDGSSAGALNAGRFNRRQSGRRAINVNVLGRRDMRILVDEEDRILRRERA